MSLPDTDSLWGEIAALRDLFISQNGEQLTGAITALAQASHEGVPPAGEDELEFAFNRLFVGPAKIAAPPYASVYLESEPQLMGRTTLEIRRLYHLLGLASPWQGSLPDDHISLELDALLCLDRALEAGATPELGALRARFLEEHLAVWLPRFLDRLRRDEATPPSLAWAAQRLEICLQAELATLEQASQSVKTGG